MEFFKGRDEYNESIFLEIYLGIRVTSILPTVGYGDTSYILFDFPKIALDAKEPTVVGPAGETFDFIQTGKTTFGKYLFAKLIVPPHVGPPTACSSLDG